MVTCISVGKFKPDISWTDVLEIANKYLVTDDLSLNAISHAVNFHM